MNEVFSTCFLPQNRNLSPVIYVFCVCVVLCVCMCMDTVHARARSFSALPLSDALVWAKLVYFWFRQSLVLREVDVDG